MRFERDSIQAHCPDALSEEEMYHRNILLLQRADWSGMARFGLFQWTSRTEDDKVPHIGDANG